MSNSFDSDQARHLPGPNFDPKAFYLLVTVNSRWQWQAKSIIKGKWSKANSFFKLYIQKITFSPNKKMDQHIWKRYILEMHKVDVQFGIWLKPANALTSVHRGASLSEQSMIFYLISIIFSRIVTRPNNV